MRHVQIALLKFTEQTGKDTPFLNIDNLSDERGIAPVVKFTIQSDPISEVGINGLQAQDMLHYTKCLFESLNEAFPSEYNDRTLKLIEEGLAWQDKRTADRLARQVEGKNLA